MSSVVLSITQLSKRFDGLKALQDVSINVERGEITAIIGPNGAGKTTLFNIISGLENPDSGRVHFNGKDITHTPAEKIAQGGIARTFQTTQTFDHLNVVENIMVGRHFHTSTAFLLSGFWLSSIYREEHRNMTRAFKVLDFIDMYDKADRKMAQISFFERKLVEIGRCLAMEPQLLLLDEPFGGLNQHEIDRMADKLTTLKEKGLTLAIIDHHFKSIAGITDRIHVIHYGQVIARGNPDTIKKHPAVLSAYLPDAYHHPEKSDPLSRAASKTGPSDAE